MLLSIRRLSEQFCASDLRLTRRVRRLPRILTPVQVDELKNKHAVYIVTAGGRINVAGMTEQNMDRLSTAIASVL